MQTWIGIALFFVGGCPALPGASAPTDGPRYGTGAEDPRPDEVVFAPSPLTPLAERAASRVSSEASPFGFLLRADVAVAADGRAATWYRVGFLLDERGLWLFELAPRAIGAPEHGQRRDALSADGVAVVAALEAAGRGEVPLWTAEDCGGRSFCAPLVELAAEAVNPVATLGVGTPTRLAVGEQALVARDASGALRVVDLR